MPLGDNRSPNQVFGASPIQIPKYGDAQLLPKGRVVRPSHERMPFGPSGALKPEGLGPYPADFLAAPDLLGLPWERDRANAWTDATLRGYVLRWLREFMRLRPALVAWQVYEGAQGPRTALRLPQDDHYLRLTVTARVGHRRTYANAAISFRVADRSDAALVRARLDLVASALDAQLAAA